MNQILNQFYKAFEQQDSEQMIECFAMLENSTNAQISQYLNNKKFQNEIANFVQKYLTYKLKKEEQDLDLAMDLLIQLTKSQNTWFMKFSKYFTRQLKNIDINLAIQNIRNFLGELQLIRSNQEKTQGILFCVNQLFWCYFKLLNYHQCRSFQSIIENNYKDIFDIFPAAEKITYHYYSARMALFENQFLRARELFCMAFELLDSYQGSNKKSITRQLLKYYIPTQILNGVMPNPQMLQEYGFDEYKQLSIAIQKGDQVGFKHQIEKYQQILIKRGLFLIMEKFKTILIRNILKKAQRIIFQTYSIHQIDTVVFQKALNLNHVLLNVQYSLDQTEFIMANLIYQGFIKGYISHDKRKVVFSRNQPFPKIQEVVKKH